jgi:hypothetical protein
VSQELFCYGEGGQGREGWLIIKEFPNGCTPQTAFYAILRSTVHCSQEYQKQIDLELRGHTWLCMVLRDVDAELCLSTHCS